MIELDDTFVFQADSDIVKSVYKNNNNYLIEYDNNQNKDHCAIYFSSNEIYFPNNEKAFSRSIIEKNKYEWFGIRVPYAHKHIFLRDIQKQWYLTGVNSMIDSPGKLLAFLESETSGYKVIALGSSAGGFAAVLFGSLLKARLILSFNGQFQVSSLLKTSNESINPILFRLHRKGKLLDYFDLKPFLKESTNVFYFYSNGSRWDCEQRNHIQNENINMIEFSTGHHGIPFLKCNLPVILRMTEEQLSNLTGKAFSPLWFSIMTTGLINTVTGLIKQTIKKYLK